MASATVTLPSGWYRPSPAPATKPSSYAFATSVAYHSVDGTSVNRPSVYVFVFVKPAAKAETVSSAAVSVTPAAIFKDKTRFCFFIVFLLFCSIFIRDIPKKIYFHFIT